MFELYDSQGARQGALQEEAGGPWALSRGLGLHSLRAGSASAVAQAGIPDQLFKQHGRWSFDFAKDGYIEDSKENRLSVLKNIVI